MAEPGNHNEWGCESCVMGVYERRRTKRGLKILVQVSFVAAACPNLSDTGVQ
jgi:hypothetical protein